MKIVSRLRSHGCKRSGGGILAVRCNRLAVGDRAALKRSPASHENKLAAGGNAVWARWGGERRVRNRYQTAIRIDTVRDHAFGACDGIHEMTGDRCGLNRRETFTAGERYR